MGMEKQLASFERVSIAFVGWSLGLIGLLAIGVFELGRLVKFLWTSF